MRMFSESARFAKSVPNTLKVHIYLYHWAVQVFYLEVLMALTVWPFNN